MNNMTDSVRHSGIVVSVSDDCVKVRIVQSSACASCKVAGHCNAAESKEKVIEVYGDCARRGLKAGDEVVVTASRNVAARALLLAFGIPFIILVGVLGLTLWLTADELAAALTSLAALAPYFFALWLLRGKLQAKMVFGIEDA